MSPQTRRDTAGEVSPEINQSLVPPIEPYPWLLCCHGESGEKQTFLTATKPSSSSGYNSHERSIPELRNKTVMVCCHGWLLLFERGTAYNYSLWNPSTLQSIVLPPLRLTRSFDVGACVLSSPPDTISSTILLFEEYTSNIMFLRIGRGHQEWVEMECGDQLGREVGPDHQDECFVYAVCCNGEVYATTWDRNMLMKVDTTDGEDLNKIVLTPLVQLPSTRIDAFKITRYLVESLGQLFLIIVFFGVVNHEIIAVEVHKLDSGRKQWKKVGTIEDQVFFLGIRNSVSCSALSESDRGCIYFTDYCYNIDNKCLSLSAFGCANLPVSYYYTRIWVMPNNHRTREDEAKGKEKISEEEAPKGISRASDTKDSKERNLADLPECIIGEISSHLALVDYMNFRTVCRVFSTAAPATEWRNTLVTTSSEVHCLTPWLMICRDGRKEYTFIDPKFSGRYFMRIPEELVDATIHCAKDGWLLMSTDDDSTFFFNPFTKAILPCPPLSLGCQASSYIMSSAPTNSNYLVMAISDIEVGVRVCTFNKGDKEWEHHNIPTGSDFLPNHNSPVLWAGYYFLGCQGNLLWVDHEPGKLAYAVVAKLNAPCESFEQNFLVECDEEMYSVFVGDHGKWVRVFIYDLSDDESTMIWREVESIGNWTMFLSRSSCVAMEAVSDEMADRIYFPRLHKDNLVFYSLKTGKFHASDGEDSLMDYADTTELLLCAWTESRLN